MIKEISKKVYTTKEITLDELKNCQLELRFSNEDIYNIEFKYQGINAGFSLQGVTDKSLNHFIQLIKEYLDNSEE